MLHGPSMIWPLVLLSLFPSVLQGDSGYIFRVGIAEEGRQLYSPSAANVENRQWERGNLKRAHLVTLRAPGRKGATGTQYSAGRLQEKSRGVMADHAFDEWAESAFDY